MTPELLTEAAGIRPGNLLVSLFISTKVPRVQVIKTIIKMKVRLILMDILSLQWLLIIPSSMFSDLISENAVVLNNLI